MNSKHYPEKFEIEAFKRVADRGHTVSRVATCLDITTPRSLYAWIKKLGPDSFTNKEQSEVQADS